MIRGGGGGGRGRCWIFRIQGGGGFDKGDSGGFMTHVGAMLWDI